MKNPVASVVVLALCLSACSQPQESLRVESQLAPALMEPTPTVLQEEFRRTFCGVLARNYAPDDTCADSLWWNGEQDGRAAASPDLEPLSRRWRVILVSGFASDCLQGSVKIFGYGRARSEGLGITFVDAPVSGLASSEWNARIVAATIADQHLQPGEGLLVVGYSKGLSDVLSAIALYPEMMSGVDAILAISGAFQGSQLASNAPVEAAEILRFLPGLTCNPTDGLAIHSMRPDVARERLARYPLPEYPPVFSIISIADDSTVSLVLRPSWRKLLREAGENDGQLTAAEQVVPQAKVLGFGRADHWAIALPIEEMAPVLTPVAARAPYFPQAALLEAAIRVIDANVQMFSPSETSD